MCFCLIDDCVGVCARVWTCESYEPVNLPVCVKRRCVLGTAGLVSSAGGGCWGVGGCMLLQDDITVVF